MSNKRNSPKRQLPKKRKKMMPSVKRPVIWANHDDPLGPGKIKSENPAEMVASIMIHQFGPDWEQFMEAAGLQTTPEAITPKLKDFAAKVAGTEPVRIPVQPLAPAMRCHMNVEDYCEQHPGAEIVYGWIIWENAKFAEAEFHAVIREHGKLICITTMPDGEKELVFFEDKERKPKVEAFGDKDHIIHTFFNVHIDTAKVHARVGMLAPGHIDSVNIPSISQ